MNSDVQPTENRRWYVFEGDYGGQIFLTIPVDMVPAWITRRRMRRLLRYLNGVAWGCCEHPEDGCSVTIFEDPGFCEPDDIYSMTAEQVDQYVAMCRTELKRLPVGVGMATIYERSFVPETRLDGWEVVGGVSGGMGGGGLLDGDLWLHYEFLFRGLDYVNGIRRLLGLKRLETLDVVMKETHRQHAAMFTAVLG